MFLCYYILFNLNLEYLVLVYRIRRGERREERYKRGERREERGEKREERGERGES